MTQTEKQLVELVVQIANLLGRILDTIQKKLEETHDLSNQ